MAIHVCYSTRVSPFLSVGVVTYDPFPASVESFEPGYIESCHWPGGGAPVLVLQSTQGSYPRMITRLPSCHTVPGGGHVEGEGAEACGG